MDWTVDLPAVNATWRPLARVSRVTAPAPASEPVRRPVLRADAYQPAPARSAITQPPGAGQVTVQQGVPLASNAGQAPGAGFEGRIARETLSALKRAGGVSAVYLSPANGNREVAVLATPGFDPARPYEVLVYNRGIEGDNTKSLEGQYVAPMLRELNAQGRNVLLVLPKSPTTMHTWFAGREDLGALVPEALLQFRGQTGIRLGEPSELWLMAHSGGGKSVQNAMQKPGAPHFDKILLADSTYGTWAGETLKALRATNRSTQVATVVTEHNAARAQAQLADQGLRVDAMPAFQYPGHNGVPAFMLRAFLGAQPTLGFSSVVR